MIVDFSVTNFHSFRDEQTLSLNVEQGLQRLRNNYSLAEGDRLAILRTAVVLGANASGKSNLLLAVSALQWIVLVSASRGEGKLIPPYEPYRLDPNCQNAPVKFEIEFIVPSGTRYRYSVSFTENEVTEESLYSFKNRQRALVFSRTHNDTWETIKFGGTFKGGVRKLPFHKNAAYLSRAGNDASAPKSIREIYKYFSKIRHVFDADNYIGLTTRGDDKFFSAVKTILCLADTGVSDITTEINEEADGLHLPEDMPDHLKKAIIEKNRITYKFWQKSSNGEPVAFNRNEMSSGTARLFDILPVIIESLIEGSPLLVDEIDAHLHSNLFHIIVRLFHDDVVNKKGSQIIFATHNINILDSNILRRDQIWFVSKESGASILTCLDEYDKKTIRPDSPFEKFYKDGRFGGLPLIDYPRIRDQISNVMNELSS